MKYEFFEIDVHYATHKYWSFLLLESNKSINKNRKDKRKWMLYPKCESSSHGFNKLIYYLLVSKKSTIKFNEILLAFVFKRNSKELWLMKQQLFKISNIDRHSRFHRHSRFKVWKFYCSFKWLICSSDAGNQSLLTMLLAI